MGYATFQSNNAITKDLSADLCNYKENIRTLKKFVCIKLPTYFQSAIYVHCFCQMSTMYPREPGVWCGPGIRCKHPPDTEINEIQGNISFIPFEDTGY